MLLVLMLLVLALLVLDLLVPVLFVLMGEEIHGKIKHYMLIFYGNLAKTVFQEHHPSRRPNLLQILLLESTFSLSPS